MEVKRTFLCFFCLRRLDKSYRNNGSFFVVGRHCDDCGGWCIQLRGGWHLPYLFRRAFLKRAHAR